MADATTTGAGGGGDPARRRLVAPAVVGLGAAVLAVGAATYPNEWFPGSRQGPWLFAFPVLSNSGLPSWIPLGAYFTAMALLGLAWIWLLRVVRSVGCSVTAVLVVAALWAAPFAVGPPVGSDDVFTYAGSGKLVARGLDPYDVGIAALGTDDPLVRAASPVWWESPQPYGPLYLRWAQLAGRVTGWSVNDTVLLLRLGGLVCLALLALPLTALARRLGTDTATVLAGVLCSPLVLVHLVGGVHNETFMLLPLVTGVAVGLAGLSARGRPRMGIVVAGIVLCGVAASVKLPALLGATALGWLAVARPSWPRRVLGSAAATILGAGAVILTSLASGLGLGWVRNLDGSQKITTILSPFTAAGTFFRNVLQDGVGVTGDVLPAFRNGGLVIGLVVVGILLSRAHRVGLPVALGGALLALALSTQVVWAWYFTWGFVFIALRTLPLPTQLAVVALNFTVTPLGPGTLDVNGHPTVSSLLVLAVTSAVLAAVAWQWWGRRHGRTSALGPTPSRSPVVGAPLRVD